MNIAHAKALPIRIKYKSLCHSKTETLYRFCIDFFTSNLLLLFLSYRWLSLSTFFKNHLKQQLPLEFLVANLVAFEFSMHNWNSVISKRFELANLGIKREHKYCQKKSESGTVTLLKYCNSLVAVEQKT